MPLTTRAPVDAEPSPAMRAHGVGRAGTWQAGLLQGLQDLNSALRAEMRRLRNEQQRTKKEVSSVGSKRAAEHSKLRDMFVEREASPVRDNSEDYRLRNEMQEHIGITETSLADKDDDIREGLKAQLMKQGRHVCYSQGEFDTDRQKLGQTRGGHARHAVEKRENPTPEDRHSGPEDH